MHISFISMSNILNVDKKVYFPRSKFNVCILCLLKERMLRNARIISSLQKKGFNEETILSKHIFGFQQGKTVLQVHLILV